MTGETEGMIKKVSKDGRTGKQEWQMRKRGRVGDAGRYN